METWPNFSIACGTTDKKMSSAGCVVPIRARTFDFFLEFSFGDSERLEQKFNADTQYLYYIKNKLKQTLWISLERNSLINVSNIVTTG